MNTGVFQSTHPVRGGTGVAGYLPVITRISIHPPREGWDPKNRVRNNNSKNFNPPTP